MNHRHISILFFAIFFFLLISPAYSGFWSSALGTAAGSAMGGSSSGNVDATKNEKKVQQVLIKLGYYKGKVDGNLDTLDSRIAIEEFQSHYKLDDSGMLTDTEVREVLYMHDLLKSYKIELADPGKKDNKRLTQIYTAFDKLEMKLSNKKLKSNLLSKKFKKEILSYRTRVQKEQKENEVKLLEHDKRYVDNHDGTVADTVTGLQWKKCTEGLSGDDCSQGTYTQIKKHKIKEYAENSDYAGHTDWRVPTIEELNSLVYCSTDKYSDLKIDGKDGSIKSVNEHPLNGSCLSPYFKPAISQSFFPHTYSSYYWSSTKSRVHKGSWNYVMHFGDGGLSYKGATWVVPLRLVRGTPKNNKSYALNFNIDYSYIKRLSTDTLNHKLWEMHERGKYYGAWEKILGEFETRKLKVGFLDTLAWVYKDNGNQEQAIKIYKEQILPKDRSQKWLEAFEKIKKN
jgi:hypothetical protein